jgi:hypothetical protein
MISIARLLCLIKSSRHAFAFQRKAASASNAVALEELGTGRTNELAHGFAFVAAEIVHDHDIAGAKRGGEDLLDIGREALTVDRTVE